jgi:hypothetical protein
VARGVATVGGSSLVSKYLNYFCAIELLVSLLVGLRQTVAPILATSSRLGLRLISYVHRRRYFYVSHDAAQDGVLLHGTTVLPEARRALSILEGDNPLRR